MAEGTSIAILVGQALIILVALLTHWRLWIFDSKIDVIETHLQPRSQIPMLSPAPIGHSSPRVRVAV